MIIYGALIFPIILVVVLWVYFKRETIWWEFILPFLVTLVFVVVSKLLIETSQVQTKEYWGSFISRTEYYEDWNEYIHQTCSYECCCDSKGNNCQTIYYDCSYVQYHPAEWMVITTTGESFYVTEKQYLYLKKKFNNESFTELGRNYHTNDGDEYYSTWQRDSVTAVPVTTTHYYENKVKAGDYTVFNLKKVDTTDVKNYHLFDYPSIEYDGYGKMDMPAVLGDNSLLGRYADKKLRYYNAQLGHKKEVRMFMLVFEDKPSIAGDYQQSYWVNANMNELVVCVGVDSKTKNITWCKPFSWTRNEKLKIELRNFIINQKQFNPHLIVDYMATSADKGFTRRDFKEFDYITIEPSTGAVVFVYIASLLICVGIGYWSVQNEFDAD